MTLETSRACAHTPSLDQVRFTSFGTPHTSFRYRLLIHILPSFHINRLLDDARDLPPHLVRVLHRVFPPPPRASLRSRHVPDDLIKALLLASVRSPELLGARTFLHPPSGPETIFARDT